MVWEKFFESHKGGPNRGSEITFEISMIGHFKAIGEMSTHGVLELYIQ